MVEPGDESQAPGAPLVVLGHQAAESLAVSVYVLVRHGAEQRPALAAAIRGSVRLRFSDGYRPVRIDFRDLVIEVADEDEEDAVPDLELSGRLGDINALLCAPLVGGVPMPTSRHGRRAIARLADGRVTVEGSLALARDLLRLLQVDAARPAGVRDRP